MRISIPAITAFLIFTGLPEARARGPVFWEQAVARYSFQGTERRVFIETSDEADPGRKSEAGPGDRPAPAADKIPAYYFEPPYLPLLDPATKKVRWEINRSGGTVTAQMAIKVRGEAVVSAVRQSLVRKVPALDQKPFELAVVPVTRIIAELHFPDGESGAGHDQPPVRRG